MSRYVNPHHSIMLDMMKRVTLPESHEWEDPLLKTWFAVKDRERGVIAFFATEGDARCFRLDYINRLLHS